MKKLSVWLILLLAAVLRFSTLSSNLTFTADESYLSYITQTIIKDFHIIWIGWSALGFDLYLGPFWIYIIYPFLALSKGDPIVLGYLSSFIGVLTVYLLYWAGKKFFSINVGLIASLLYATLPLIVLYDQKPYPPAVPLLSLILLVSLIKSLQSKKWWVIFAIAYGMVFHIHLSLVPIGFIALYLLWIQRKMLNKRIIASAITAFIITVSPLIAFDYFKKGSNITAPIRALASVQKSNTNVIPEHFTAFARFMGRVFYLHPFTQGSDEIIPHCVNSTFSTFSNPPVIISGISVLILVVFLFNKSNWKNKDKRILLLFTLAYLIPFIFVTIINPVEYYLLGFIPIFLLIISLVVEKLRGPQKNVSYLLILSAVLIGIFTSLNHAGDFGIGAKKKLIIETSNILNGQSFYLLAEGDCQKVGGWRYLFNKYGQTPSQSTDDNIFGWLYPDELSEGDYKYTVVIEETRAHDKSRKYDYEHVISEGGFTAYVLKK